MAPPARPGGSGRWLRPLLLLALAAAVAWGAPEALKLWRARTAADEAAAGGPTLVRVAPATRGPRDTTLNLPGDVIAFEDSPVYARVDGYVRRWTVDIGDRVKAGQLLAEIETPELNEQLSRAQALVLQARANLEIARITWQRYLGLVKTNAVSQQDVDNNLAAYEARKADVTAAEAEVGRLSAMTGFRNVYAPFDGVVGARNLAKATTGALIDLGSHDPKGWLYRVYRLDPIRVYVAVPQNFLPLVRDGLAAELALREYPERRFTGRVVRNAAALDPASRTLLVEVDVPNSDGVLLPGMYATVTFHLVNDRPPIVIADSSLRQLADGPQVSVVGADDTVTIRRVRVGRDFGRTLEILSGVNEGERIVLSPSDLLRDGMKVRIAPPANASR